MATEFAFLTYRRWLALGVLVLIMPCSFGNVLQLETLRTQSINVGDQQRFRIELDETPVWITLNQPYLNLQISLRSSAGEQVLIVGDALTNTGGRSFLFEPPAADAYQVEITALPGSNRSGVFTLQFSRTRFNVEQLGAERAYAQLLQHGLGENAIDRTESLESARLMALEAVQKLSFVNRPNSLLHARFELGNVLLEQSEFVLAADEFRKIVNAKKKEKTLEIWAYANLGRALLRQSKLDEAQQAFEHGHALAIERKDVFALATALNYLGLTAQYKNAPVSALNWYELALEAFRKLTADHLLAVTLSNVGGVHYQTGRFDKALQNYEKALAIHNELNDVNGQATVLGNMASLLRDQGELGRSLDLNLRTQTLYELLGDSWGENLVAHRLGILYQRMGDSTRARTWFERAYTGRLKTNSIGAAANSLSYIGDLFHEEGNFDKAIDAHRRALAFYEQTSHSANISSTKVRLAADLFSLSDYEEAEVLVNAALISLRKSSSKDGIAKAVKLLANIKAETGEVDAAKELYRESFTLLSELSDPMGQADVQIDQAALELDENLKLKLLLSAKKRINKVRENIFNPRHRATFVATNSRLNERLIETLFALHLSEPQAGFDQQAFLVSESGRARSLLEWIERSKDHYIKKHLELLRKRRQLQYRLNGLSFSRMTFGGEARNAEIKQTLAKNNRDILTLSSKIDVIDGQLMRPMLGRKITESLQIEALQSVLEPGELLLHYHIGQTRSIRWAISSTAIQALPLAGRSELSVLVYNALQALHRDGYENSVPALETLSRVLLPESLQSDNVTTIYVVVDEFLRYVPFSALSIEPNRFIAQQATVSNVPAATMLLGERTNGVGTNKVLAVAVFADPVFDLSDIRLRARLKRKPKNGSDAFRSSGSDGLRQVSTTPHIQSLRRLPYTSVEARAIKRAHPNTTIISGVDASKSAVLDRDLTEYDVLHFATHGIVNDRDSNLSGLLMSSVDASGQPIDGFLSLGEISTLRLKPSLVVLSACETGLGENLAGEGLMSLSRIFMAQGAHDVVSTLWQVADRPATVLVGEFYQALINQEKSPAEALRLAQQHLIESDNYSEPYYWAGYVLSSAGVAPTTP